MKKKGLVRGSSFRIKRRNRDLKKGWLTPPRILLVAFISILFIAGIMWYIHNSLWIRLVNSPDLSVKNVRVLGDYPDIEEIKVEFDRYCIKKYNDKRPNILKLDLDGLRRHLESLPKVDKVRIKRRFPETLFIEVKRRIPMAFILNNTSILGFDGHRVFEIDLPFKYDLPFITGLKKVQGKEIREATRIILEIEETIPSLLPMISEINASNLEDIFAYTTDGVKIYFGNINNYNLEDRLVRLKEILDYTKRANLKSGYVDLRFSKIAVKPKG